MRVELASVISRLDVDLGKVSCAGHLAVSPEHERKGEEGQSLEGGRREEG